MSRRSRAASRFPAVVIRVEDNGPVLVVGFGMIPGMVDVHGRIVTFIEPHNNVALVVEIH